MANILVTGGAGYIGSHACKALAKAGYTPIAYDNLVYGHSWAVLWGPLEKGDIADKSRLDKIISRYKPEAVMHFAAYAYARESVQNPVKYYRNNVAGSSILLETVLDHDIDKFIFSSSCAIYGMPEVLPIPEKHTQCPINPYGSSKLIVERMLRDLDVAHGIRSVSLRYFNAAGADIDAEIGEDHNPETHLIPLVLDTALDRRPSIAIYGDDYPTPDGTCIRDYIHVVDLVDAHILGLMYLEKGGKTACYNLGNGQGFSVNEVIETAHRVTGKEIPTVLSPRQAGDTPVLIADARLAMKNLGWSPQYPALETQIMHAWEWHQRHFKA